MKIQPLKDTMVASNEVKEFMVSITKMLTDAVALNNAGKHSETFTLAYNASDKIAMAYLLGVTGRQYPEGWDTYELFDATLREPERHPAFLQQIREIAGDVYVLRETYAPSLSDETTKEDAQLMIDRVSELGDLMEKIFGFKNNSRCHP